MKKSIIIGALALSMGCIGPMAKWNRAETNLTEQKETVQQAKNDAVELAKGYVHGTKKALEKVNEQVGNIQDPVEKEKVKEPLVVAEKLNERAGLALGPPSVDDALAMEEIVDELLSENEELREDGAAKLAAKDRQLANVQNKLDNAENKLGYYEQKLLEIGRANSAMAEKWDSLVSMFWWAIGIGVFLLVLSIVIRIVPIIFPAISATGGAFSRMVRAVEEVRGKHKIDNILRENLDERDRLEIDREKRRLGIK